MTDDQIKPEPPHVMSSAQWERMQNEKTLTCVTVTAAELAQRFPHPSRSAGKTIYTSQK